MSDTKKYYWLKLKRDFFKRHDITVIESMPNGDKYILFYMKMLVESIDHDGALRFSDTVPYNDTMLAAITRTDIDIVRSAVKIFEQFGMMEMLDDGTLFMRQIESMIGDETEWAAKKREYREKQKLIEAEEGQKRTLSDKSIEYRDKSIETIEDNPKKTNVFSPVFDAYIEMYKSIYNKEPVIVYGRITNQLKTLSKDLTIDQIILAIEQSRNDDFSKKVKHELGAILSSGVIGRLINESCSKPLPPKISVPRRCRHIDSSGNQCEGEIFNSYCKVCGAMYDGSGNEIL